MDLHGWGIVAVIDGMGGRAGGALASRIASAAIADLNLAAASSSEEVNSLLQEVADTVRETGANRSGYALMGATIAGLVLQRDSVILFNVGDCSILRVRDGFVGQLAIIDRAVNEEGRHGVVTQALGGTPQPIMIDAHAEVFIPSGDDLLVLCSDGLTDTLDNNHVVSLAAEFSEPGALADELVAAACKAGAPDNVSVIVLDFSKRKQVPAVDGSASRSPRAT